MTDEKDMAKQLKYRAGDVVTLKVARLGEMGAFLDAGTGDTSDDILLHKRSMLAMKLKSICIKIRMAV